jgi:hypothetical protein
MNPEDSTNTYRLMLDKLDEIERSLDRIDASSTKNFSQDMETMLENIKSEDRQRSSLMTASQRSIVEMILKKNALIVGRIQGITAMQRSELNQLHLGIQTAKGYASQRPARTGSIINSSN